MGAARKAAAPVVDEVVRLNELARLYPWRVFDQGELQQMTGYSREVISEAFRDEVFPSQYGKARPESVSVWVGQQPAKAMVKDLR